MVVPSWESFQSPNQQSNQQIDSQQENELKQEIPGEIKDQKKPEGEKPQWGDFQDPSTFQGEPDPTEEENIFEYAIRNIATNSSRLAEQFAGRYGNLEKFGKSMLSDLPKSGGVLGWAISELVGPEKWEQMVKGREGRQQILPTSKQLKELSQKVTGGYTKPKTKGEEKFQEFTEDVGATISGRTFQNIAGRSIARNVGLNNILIPAAANITKEIVENTGFGKDKANLAKAAIWFPLSLAANVSAPAFAANLMNIGRQGFGRNVTANVPRYQNQINTISRNMLQGDPRSSLAQQQLSGINNDITNGQTSMRDLMNRYDAINAAKRDRGLFALNPDDRRAAIRNINEVRDVVRGEIEHLGQSNPNALESWRNGVTAFATIHRSTSIKNAVESLAKGPYAKLLVGPAAGLFGISSLVALKAPIIAGPLAATTAATYKTGQTLYRMWNNRQLSDYYWRAISAAESENIPAFLNNYNKLNKDLEKSEPTKPKSKSKK